MRSLFRKIREANRPFCTALVAAAGSSSRMGGTDKLMEFLDNVPVLMRTLTALQRAAAIDEIVIAAREDALVDISTLCKTYGITKCSKVVRGGESLLVNPGCVLLLGPGGGLLQQAGHIAPELIGCRFPAGVLPVLKNLMQRDFMPLFEPGAQTALYGPVQWSGRLRTLLGMMQSAESEPESPGMIYLALILHYVEQECRSERQDIRPRNETVEQICAYLAANYQQKLSLTEVAARFYISPYYLSRLFRRVTGQSIVDYINARRIEAAQKLLETTELSIGSVAEQTGFASAAHFRRVFRETMGVGPLQYRKSRK